VGGFGDLIEANGLVGKLTVGAQPGVVGVFVEAEETEPFSQFHYRTGLGLGRCRPLAHLLLCPDDGPGIVAAGTEEYGNIQPAIVDAYGLLQDIQVHGLHASFDRGNGLLRLPDFILIVGRLLNGVGHFDGTCSLHVFSLVDWTAMYHNVSMSSTRPGPIHASSFLNGESTRRPNQ